MLCPASRPAHHFTCGSLQWLSLIAIEVNHSHATTTGFGPGIDLGVVFLVWAQGSCWVFCRWTMHAAIMRRCSSCMTNERPGCSHDMGMVVRILKLMMTSCLDKWWCGSWNRWCSDVRMKFIGHVSGSCDQIMWVVTCRDHMIGKSCDHDITIAFPLGRELCWA